MNRQARRAKARNKNTQAAPVEQPTAGDAAPVQVVKIEELVEGFNKVLGTFAQQFQIVCLNLTYAQLELARLKGEVPENIINPVPPLLIDCKGDVSRRLPTATGEQVAPVPTQAPEATVPAPAPTVAAPGELGNSALENLDRLRQTAETAQRSLSGRSNAPSNRLRRVEDGDDLNAPQFQAPVPRKGMLSRRKEEVKNEDKLLAPKLLTIEDIARAYIHGSEVIRGRGVIRIGLPVGDTDVVEDAGTINSLDTATALLPGFDESFQMYDELTADDDAVSGFFATIAVPELGSSGRVFVCAHQDYAFQLNLVPGQGNSGEPVTEITPKVFYNDGERYEAIAPDQTALETFARAVKILAGVNS